MWIFQSQPQFRAQMVAANCGWGTQQHTKLRSWEIIPQRLVSVIFSAPSISQRNNQCQFLIAKTHILWWFFYLLQFNTSHWKTWVLATRIKVCVSTLVACRWTLWIHLVWREKKRERQRGERDGEQRVWPAKWLSQSPSLLSDKSNANWQSALWLRIHWLPPLHRWSLSHTCMHTHATQQHNQPPVHTHTSTTGGTAQPQWVIALCIKQVNLCRKNNAIWVWQTFLITHRESIFNSKNNNTNHTFFFFLSLFFFCIIKILWI